MAQQLVPTHVAAEPSYTCMCAGEYVKFASASEQMWGAAGGSSISAQVAAESSRLSRGFTIYGALLRMGLLPELQREDPTESTGKPCTQVASGAGRDSRRSNNVVLHVLGADGREGNTPQESSAVFSWLCQQLHRHNVEELRLLLIGPHVSPAMHNTTHSGLLGSGGSARLKIEYSTDLYHERVCPGDRELSSAASLELGACPVAFCFNAGVWGYDSWLPTIAAACRPGSHLAAVVITSYNTHEAADDRDTLEDAEEEGRLMWLGHGAEGRGAAATAALRWLWGPEENPFRSRESRESSTVPGRALADNHSWQCIAVADSALGLPPLL